MSIRINQKECIGCRRCTEVCPGNLLVMKNSKATIRDVRDCWGCTACVKICPKNAIHYFLAPDLGGAGGKLFATDSDRFLTWIIQFPDGRTETIAVDKQQSNQY